MLNDSADTQGHIVLSLTIMGVLLMFSSFFPKDSGLLWLFGCPGRTLHREEDGRADYGSASCFRENLDKLWNFSDLQR